MKRKLVCICLSMAVFGTLLSGCGEGKSEKESGGSGQADVDVESYDTPGSSLCTGGPAGRR